MTRLEFETALDAGQLEIKCINGKYYKARRNGKTKTWKRDATRFETPIKWGFRSCYRVTEHDMDSIAMRIRATLD